MHSTNGCCFEIQRTMPSQKKISIPQDKAILWSVVTGFMITLVIIWNIRGPSSDNLECRGTRPCTQSDLRPTSNQLKLWKLSSPDHRTLVHLKGYLEFTYTNRRNNLNAKKFLGLDLRSIDWSERSYKTNMKIRSLVVDSSCSQIKLDYYNAPNKTMWQFFSGSMAIDLHGMDALYHNCSLDSPGDFEVYTHYRCPQLATYKCRERCSSLDPSTFQVSLHLEEFEFEFSGKPDQLRDDQFSKRGHECNKTSTESESSL